MSVPARLVSFAAVLAVVFGVGWGIGAAVGPFEDGSRVTPHLEGPPAPTTPSGHSGTSHGEPIPHAPSTDAPSTAGEGSS